MTIDFCIIGYQSGYTIVQCIDSGLERLVGAHIVKSDLPHHIYFFHPTTVEDLMREGYTQLSKTEYNKKHNLKS